jgi:hypothetical protein
MVLGNVQAGREAAAAAFVVATQSYATANPQPAWVDQVTNDGDFINHLLQDVAPSSDQQTLGNPFSWMAAPIMVAAAKLKQAVKGAIGTAIDRGGDFASTKLLGTAREPLNAVLGKFFGDIFLYFDGRGLAVAPGAIPSTILKAFDDARAADPGGPLVIVGHSLGGVISFDLLGYFRPDIECDLFVSVGSQIGHFEEMKLFKASDPNVRQGQKAKTPTNIKRWINIYDEVDIFSYAIRDIFDRYDVDAPYDTMTYTIKAHSAYFDQDRFYQRVRARIDQLP